MPKYAAASSSSGSRRASGRGLPPRHCGRPAPPSRQRRPSVNLLRGAVVDNAGIRSRDQVGLCAPICRPALPPSGSTSAAVPRPSALAPARDRAVTETAAEADRALLDPGDDRPLAALSIRSRGICSLTPSPDDFGARLRRFASPIGERMGGDDQREALPPLHRDPFLVGARQLVVEIDRRLHALLPVRRLQASFSECALHCGSSTPINRQGAPPSMSANGPTKPSSRPRRSSLPLPYPL
jgi:hypothetical protein